MVGQNQAEATIGVMLAKVVRGVIEIVAGGTLNYKTIKRNVNRKELKLQIQYGNYFSLYRHSLDFRR